MWASHRDRSGVLVCLVVAAVAAGAGLPSLAGPASTPCPTIGVVNRLDGAPVEASEALVAALAEMQRRTGVTFTFAAGSPEDAAPGAGVIVATTAWDVPPVQDPLGLLELGRAEVAGTSQLGGIIRVNAAAVQPGSSSRDTWSGVLLHELGHLLGLDHSTVPADLMYPELLDAPPVWSPAERDALASIGASLGCVVT